MVRAVSPRGSIYDHVPVLSTQESKSSDTAGWMVLLSKNLAVMVIFLSTTKTLGLVLPDKSPSHLLNTAPVDATAVAVTVVPCKYCA